MSERSQAHAAQARADLERAVAALRDSDAWRRNLAVMARFHRPRRQRIPRSWISHQERDFTLATY